MKFVALSRQAVEEGWSLLNPDDFQLNLTEPECIVISITNPGSLEANIKNEFKAILRLQFWDAFGLEQKDAKGNVMREIFTEDHARQILSFVEAHKDVPWCIVQCEAGRSRSVGVAAALTKLATGDDEEFFKRHNPNRLVHKTILVVAAAK